MSTAPASLVTPVAPPVAGRPKRKTQAHYLVAYQARHPSFSADSYVFAETMAAYHKCREGNQWRGFGRYGNCSEMIPFLQAMQELVEHQGWSVQQVADQLHFETQGGRTPDSIGLHLFVDLFKQAPDVWIALG